MPNSKSRVGTEVQKRNKAELTTSSSHNAKPVVSGSLHNTLLKWWDFMDEDCTAHRNEYTEQEQNELLQRFLSSNDR